MPYNQPLISANNAKVSSILLKYLRIAYSHFGDGDFRQVDLSRKLDVRQPTVSKMMDRLMAMRLIEVVREDPPSRYVRLSGTSLIAFGWSPR